MILRFTFSNFRAFKGTQTLNLASSKADKHLSENCFSPDLPGLKGGQWVKAAALYGANASGKSSVLEALKCLSNFVSTSAKTTDPKDSISGIEPFALNPGEPIEPTAFGIIFVAEGVRYEYRVAATHQQIFHESLRAFPSSTGKEQLWFSRAWDVSTRNFEWAPDRPTGYQPDPKKREFTLPNVLFLSKAISLGDTQLEPVFRWFKEGLRFFDLSVRMRGLDNEFTIDQFSQKTPLATKVIKVLRHADLGVLGAKVNEPESLDSLLQKALETLPPEKRSIPQLLDEPEVGGAWRRMLTSRLSTRTTRDDDRIELLHRGANGREIGLPWSSESAGTRRLFSLAGPLLDILEKGQTVCIDELETSMHPRMVNELLKLIFSDESNPGGAQVLFTSHNPLLLDPTLLRRDQVWFTEKDVEGVSHLYPLTDYQPRPDESLARGYLAGRYGGIPYIPHGLLGSVDLEDFSQPATKSEED